MIDYTLSATSTRASPWRTTPPPLVPWDAYLIQPCCTTVCTQRGEDGYKRSASEMGKHKQATSLREKDGR